MIENPEPKLAPPGAGLPKPELYIARLLFATIRLTGNRHSFDIRYQNERSAIRKLMRSCPGDDGAKRVLIKRPAGLEDSSRYWSIWMTLDHLQIMNVTMSRVISSLAEGVEPPGKASTANVKPDPRVTMAVVQEYEKSCDDFVAKMAGIENLKTKTRYNHPWFGPLNAADWHALAGTHMGIHRVQIERIIKGLPDKSG